MIALEERIHFDQLTSAITRSACTVEPMTSFLIGYLSLTMADWGPLPFESGPAPMARTPAVVFSQTDTAWNFRILTLLDKTTRSFMGNATPRQTLIQASEEVAWLAWMQTPYLSVISVRKEADISAHKSHQVNSDADVGIFYKKEKKKTSTRFGW